MYTETQITCTEVEGKYLQTGGGRGTSADYNVYTFGVNGGEKIKITTSNYVGTRTMVVVAFYNSSSQSTTTFIEYRNLINASENSEKEFIYMVPNNAKSVAFTCSKTQPEGAIAPYASFLISNIDQTNDHLDQTNDHLDQTDEDVDILKTQLNENLLDYIETINPTNWYNPDATTSGIMEVNGTVTQNIDYIYTDYIPVKENDILACYEKTSSSINKIYHYRIAVFDENKNPISNKGSGDNSRSIFPIPTGIAYAIVTILSSYNRNLPIIVLDGIDPTSYTPYFEPYDAYTKDFLTVETAEAVSKLTDGTIPAQIQQNTEDINGLNDALVSERTRAGSAENLKVNIPLDQNNQPVNGTNGQLLRTKGDGSTEWASVGEPSYEQIKSAVEDVLDTNPDWRSTVNDGSLTESKFSNPLKLKTLKEYYTPEMYGAVGDGTTDDKLAIITMLANVPDNALCVFYNNYYISGGIEVTRPVNIIMYGTLTVSGNAEYCVKISGHNVRRNKFRLNLYTDSTIKSQWNTHHTIALDCYETWENEFDVSIWGFNTGIRLISTNNDCSYNKIFIRNIYACKTAILLTGDAGSTGGTTSQNTFIGGRIGTSGGSAFYLDKNDLTDCYHPVKSVLVGNRSNNNNNFISCSFEGLVPPDQEKEPDKYAEFMEHYTNRAHIVLDMNYCVALGCRFEKITSFESQVNCVVISGYGFSSIANKSGNYASLGVSNGVGNMKFVNGRPQWYDGTNWVYADGTIVN